MVGAFWDTITFTNTAKANEAPCWAVVLKSGKAPAYAQGFNLATGKKVELAGGPEIWKESVRLTLDKPAR